MNIKIISLALLLFLLTFSMSEVIGQTLPKELSTTEIDDLSDQQMRQLLRQAQASGLTDAEIVQSAVNRGLPQNQALMLEKRIKSIRGRQQAGNATTDGIAGNDTTPSLSRQLNYKLDTTDSIKRVRQIFDNLYPKVFGASLFTNSNLSFSPNLKLATPANYIVGPEDQLEINVYGNSLVNWKLNVSPEGNINIPGIGFLNVGGKRIDQATTAIKAKLAANNYAIGRGTNVQVSLGNIRSIKVIMVGQVVKPGTYTLPSLATVFNALYSAGGPSENGSYRQIQIIRDNRLYRTLDVYDFLVKGDQKNNVNLQDQDVIRIPTYKTRVELAGEVKIPGLFEMLPGESLQTLLDFAGGFTEQAYALRVKVAQVNGKERRLTDVVEADFSNYVPLRGDKFTVSRILERYENRVTILGAVFRPGEYELQKGLTLGGLIAKADGLKEDAFTGRGSITRLKDDNTTEILSFDLKGIMDKNAPDPALRREDVIYIASAFDLRDKYRVIINGEVRKPGEFAYADSMTVEDLIIKSGGFTEGASTKRIEIARRVNTSDPNSINSPVAQVFSVNVDPGLKSNATVFRLKPFDMVSIYSLPGYEKQKTVKVEGEVLYPGYYTIQKKNEKISDLIKRAGGTTVFADIDGSTLRRSNIAILGVDKNKVDTAEIARERFDRLNRLKKTYKDSTRIEDSTVRNNFIGIELKKILKAPGSYIDLLLEDGDVIRIPKQQQIVRVNGEVLFPSAVVYNEHKSFSDYVYNAGGFSPVALKRGAYVVYPNGTVAGTHKFLFFNVHPKVKPGSEIVIPKKPAGRGNIGQEIIGYTTGLASLAAIIFGIISLNK